MADWLPAPAAELIAWLRHHETLLWILFLASIVMFVGSLIAIPILIARLPATYFMHRKPPPESWRAQHAVIRMLILITKNVLGVVFIVAGIAMLVLPGQGILSIFLGVTLLNFPGKRRLELAIVRTPALLRAIQWIRARAKRPPLEVPPTKRRDSARVEGTAVPAKSRKTTTEAPRTPGERKD